MSLVDLARKSRSAIRGAASRLRDPWHEAELRQRLEALGPDDRNPRTFLRGCDDRFLLWSMGHAHESGLAEALPLPALPSAWHQRNWTGAAGDETLVPALEFQRLVHRVVDAHGSKPFGSCNFLDFGSGWGRILRFFLRDVPAENLHGRDCWKEIVEISSRDNPWCDFQHIGVLPPLPDAAGSIDVVYLVSVFSHLSEAAHLAWMEEFHRVLAPGGLVIATTRAKDYLLRMDRNRRKDRSKGAYQSMLATDSFPDIQATLRDYEQGRHCYSPTGGGGPLDAEFYGEAAIPPGYPQEHWAGFEIVQTIAPHGSIDQLTFVARKL